MMKALSTSLEEIICKYAPSKRKKGQAKLTDYFQKYDADHYGKKDNHLDFQTF